MLVEGFLVLIMISLFFDMLMQPTYIDVDREFNKHDRAMWFFGRTICAIICYGIYYFGLYTCAHQELFNGAIVILSFWSFAEGLVSILFYKNDTVTTSMFGAIVNGVFDIIILFELLFCMTM